MAKRKKPEQWTTAEVGQRIVGAFSIHEIYTIDEIALRIDRSRDWVYKTFIRPVDHQTKLRLKDKDGRPVPGVVHFSLGNNYLVTGRALMAWVEEHARANEEE